MKIIAVIVAFHPNLEQLRILCDQLLGISHHVLVVDNTPQPQELGLGERIQHLPLLSNTGIAHAQNVGAQRALQMQADVVAFFDQDSCPEEATLVAMDAAISTTDFDILAPTCVDSLNREVLPAYRLSVLGIPHPIYADGPSVAVPVDLVISSGNFVRSRVFQRGVWMDRTLFIDYVDFEWCFRCRRHGFSVGLVSAARMSHRIGEKTLQYAGVRTSLHGPARSYYKLRNPLLLLRRREVPVLYALRELTAAVLQALVVLRQHEHRKLYLSAFLSGVRDGLLNRSGPKPANG
ncbi:hypothetical protein [Silanimonas sp.]|jgi:rhamnosyltransferase|uniref:hypothetical protein n=1 Tax=Silanimonas sp. TaxID=1929290 RepID=UPI0022BCAB73|nr:hypothetical protein [Silanimonas sp.]MCZ8167492.1 hypothetical protein [Silanimonas sp.]